jgi:hypothetical protein
VLRPPAEAGVELARWCWKAVREFAERRFGVRLCRSSCLNYLHRLGLVRKRPKKRLLKADAAKREAFVAAYAAAAAEAAASGAKLFFADEAHFRADGDPRAMWVPRGEPALVDSTSPRWGEKASYYSAVCPETGEVEAMPIEGNSNAATSAAFLGQLRAAHRGPLRVYWDNSPAHRGEPIRDFLAAPGLDLALANLPAYSPDFNADEAIWGWARAEVTADTCFGTKEKVRAAIDRFLAGLAERKDEVKRRCRTELHARAEALAAHDDAPARQPVNAHPPLASV